MCLLGTRHGAATKETANALGETPSKPSKQLKIELFDGGKKGEKLMLARV